MQSIPQIIPLVILAPAIGAFINYFWGAKMGERAAAYLAVGASVLTFIFSVLIFSSLSANNGLGSVINPPIIFDGWIRIGAEGSPVTIPWQFRVDTLTTVMLLVVSGVGSLIHIYSVGYIHGDPKAPLFFAYLNMFLMFMLILITGNNFLMMFVGWEGVGLCSFLLIGYWWDKKGAEGWKNSNAARKAMILNRIGDFGILMAIFLIFWTFGTLDFYRPGETANPQFQLVAWGYEQGEAHGEAEEHGDEGTAAEGEHSEDTTAEEEHDEGTAAAEAGDEHGETEEHGEADEHAGDEDHGEAAAHGPQPPTRERLENVLLRPEQHGVFGQIQLLMSLDAESGETMVWGQDIHGNTFERGRRVNFGAFAIDIEGVLTLIVLFMLLGVTGKSAQVPLFVWLPDAMAGPTPVSALIHAATMVTAGVYLMVRSNVMLDAVPDVRFIIALIGAATALVGGFTAVAQWDIKRVLAYSTVSQLGFMVAAVGIGAYTAAMFHLVTHAVFKALLFLGSGSVIHGVEHGEHHVHEMLHAGAHGHDDAHHDEHEAAFDPQDMRNMGGLAQRMPVTFITYLVGTFALAGLPIFAGFWSKDEILLDAYYEGFIAGHGGLEASGAIIVFFALLVAAFFTAFYMWRQIQMVFFGTPRSDAARYAPESTGWMTIPLLLLGLGSIFIGLINVPDGFWPFSAVYKHHEFRNFLEPSLVALTQGATHAFNLFVGGLATGLAFLAIFLAHWIYAGDKAVQEAEDGPGKDPLFANRLTRPFWNYSHKRMLWDELYHALILTPYERIGYFLAQVLDWEFWHDYFHNTIIKRGYDGIARFLSNPVDLGLIDGIVNGVGSVIRSFSNRMRGIQTGYVRTYAVILLLGVVAIILVMIWPLLLNGS